MSGAIQVAIFDTHTAELVNGECIFHLELPVSRMTAAQLIAARVEAELAQSPRGRYQALFAIHETEKVLNPGSPGLDLEREIARALRAFRANRFFLIVDGRQVDDSDGPVEMRDGSEVKFLRLLPLVGG